MEIWNFAIASNTVHMSDVSYWRSEVEHYKQNMKVITINIKAHHGTWLWTSFINFPSLQPNSIGSTFCIYYMVIIQEVSPPKTSVYVPLVPLP